jgi:hypothetical protein
MFMYDRFGKLVHKKQSYARQKPDKFLSLFFPIGLSLHTLLVCVMLCYDFAVAGRLCLVAVGL